MWNPFRELRKQKWKLHSTEFSKDASLNAVGIGTGHRNLTGTVVAYEVYILNVSYMTFPCKLIYSFYFRLEDRSVKEILFQVLQAVNFCHQHNVRILLVCTLLSVFSALCLYLNGEAQIRHNAT